MKQKECNCFLAVSLFFVLFVIDKHRGGWYNKIKICFQSLPMQALLQRIPTEREEKW